MSAKQCPFCNNRLVYRGIEANIDVVTETWVCTVCKGRMEIDTPGLRNADQLDTTSISGDEIRKIFGLVETPASTQPPALGCSVPD